MIKEDDLSLHIHNPQLSFAFVCRRFVGTDYTLKGLVCGGTLTKSLDYYQATSSYGVHLRIEGYPVYNCSCCDASFSIDHRTGKLVEGHESNQKVLEKIFSLAENMLYFSVYTSVNDLRSKKVSHVSIPFKPVPGDCLHIHHKDGCVEPYELKPGWHEIGRT